MLATFWLCLAAAPPADKTWKNITYLGGAPGVRVDIIEPHQVLILTPGKLTIKTIIPATQTYGRHVKAQEKLLVELQRDSLRAVTYKNYPHERRLLQSLVPTDKWPDMTDHLVIIDYRLPDGREPEILLRLDKKNYEEIVSALKEMVAPPEL